MSDRAARSSSSSHYSDIFETATAGKAEHDFYGISLQNDLQDATVEELMGLAALVVSILILQPSRRRWEIHLAFGFCVLGICYSVLPQVTLVPLLTTVVYTRTTYPYLVVIPHCIVSAVTYRAKYCCSYGKGTETNSQGQEDNPNRTHYLQSFLVTFFCYGFGGSIVSDLLMGLPVTALAHPRIGPCYLLAWLLVWYSPFDLLYRWCTQSQHGWVFYFLTAFEAVDAVTTPMGRISRSARELRTKVTAPLVAGTLAGAGGASLRYVVFGYLHSDQKLPLWNALEAAIWRTLGYSILWWWLVVQRCDAGTVDPHLYHCGAYNGSDSLRVGLVTAHVLWNLAGAAGVVSGHPFVWLSKTFREVLSLSVVFPLQLGPISKQSIQMPVPVSAAAGKKTN